MSNKLEQQLKQSLEKYPVEYNPTDWNDLEKRLDKVMPVKPNNASKTWILGSLSAIIGVSLLTYILWPEHGKQVTNQVQTATVSEPVIKNLEPTVLESPNDVIAKKQEQVSNPKSLALEPQTESVSTKTMAEPIQTNMNMSENIVPKPTEPIAQATTKTTQMPEKPNMPIQASIRAKQEACADEEITFTAESACQNCQFTWNLGHGTTQTGSTAKTSFDEAGQYVVQLTVSQNEETRVFEKRIVINSKPQADLEFNYTVEDQIPTYHFTYNQKDVPEVQWTFASDKKYSGSACHHVFYEKGMHDIHVKAISNKGCIQEFTKSVDIENPLTLMAPNSFSPNGDGKNETWMPILLQENNMPFTLQIFDRNKNLVYTTSNPNAGWNGHLMTTNKKVAMGQVFVWFAEVQINAHERRGFKGEIIVVE